MTLSSHLSTGFDRFVGGAGVFSLALSSLLLSTTAPLRAADFTVQDGITLSNQNVTLGNGDTGTILFGGTITDPDDAITASGNVTIDNAGTIISTGGANDDGIVHSAGMLTLINRATGVITGFDEAIQANTITSLINFGKIIAVDEHSVQANTITSLTNFGTITANKFGVYTTSSIDNLVNSGTIYGGFDGVNTTTLTNLINTGKINGGTDGVTAATVINLINSGTITGGTADGVDVNGTLTSLINSGTISGTDNGVEAISLISLTNSGKITGGSFSIQESGAVDTLLTLLPGSDLFGTIDLGGGTNTLVIGDGLSVDYVFATVPDVINSNGAPLFVIGNRVVVVDTSSLGFAQQDEQLFDLSSGIWGTVFNNIGDGRNPAATFANGSVPQFSLGAVPPGETTNSTKNTHMWANVFGNRRTQNGDNIVRHDLGGLITGLDGRYNSTTRLGAFFGASKTDIDSIGTQETEVENIFGGLYASYKTEGLTIDLGVTGGVSEHESSRLVDNNQIDGLQTVSSSFDGTFIAPELSISSQLNLRGAILQPTLRVGYAGMFLDGYTETGGTAPLTVGDRDLHLLHARFELAVIMSSSGPDSIGFSFSPYVGVEGRSLVGGEAVNITLLGQNLSFNPGGEDDIASAFAGMRFSILRTENFGIFAGIEGSIDTEQSSTLTGNLGVKWLF